MAHRKHSISNGVKQSAFNFRKITICSLLIAAICGVIYTFQITRGSRDWKSAFGVEKPREITIINSNVSKVWFPPEKTFYFELFAPISWSKALISELQENGTPNSVIVDWQGYMTNDPEWYREGVEGAATRVMLHNGVQYIVSIGADDANRVFVAGGY